MDIQLTYRTSGNSRLTITIESNFDSVLLVLDPAGVWHFDDDSGPGSNGRLVFQRARDGTYDIWAGTYSQSKPLRATVAITER
jgi:hypothetical protein